MTVVDPHAPSGNASSSQLCLQHRSVDADPRAPAAGPDGAAVPLCRLVEALASLERMVDALRRDVESGDRTIRLLSEAQAASTQPEPA